MLLQQVQKKNLTWHIWDEPGSNFCKSDFQAYLKCVRSKFSSVPAVKACFLTFLRFSAFSNCWMQSYKFFMGGSTMRFLKADVEQLLEVLEKIWFKILACEAIWWDFRPILVSFINFFYRPSYCVFLGVCLSWRASWASIAERTPKISSRLFKLRLFVAFNQLLTIKKAKIIFIFEWFFLAL